MCDAANLWPRESPGVALAVCCPQTKVFLLKWVGPECESWGIVSNLEPVLSRLVVPWGIPGGQQVRMVVALGPSKNRMLTTRQAVLLLPSLLCLPVGSAEGVFGV